MKFDDLVFQTDKGTWVTDSMRVAKHTGRAHKNIRKSVKRLIANGYDALFYEIRQGNLMLFVMNKQGFSLVTKTLPGLEEWRKAALSLFNGAKVQLPQPTTKTPVEGKETAIEDIISIKTDEAYCIDARQLHTFLGNSYHFTDWFNRRCEQYDFTNGVDYATIVQKDLKIGSPSKIYAITMDMAKELAMVEGNERGKMARKYFIEAEKRFRQMVKPTTPAIPQTFAEALRLAASQAEQIEQQQRQIEADAPKVAFANAIITSKSNCGIDELAKLITQNGLPMGEVRLFKWMREKGFLCNAGTAHNQPSQKALEQGLFEIVPKTWTHPKTGETMTTTRTMVTGKGKEYFVNRFLYNNQQNDKEP